MAQQQEIAMEDPLSGSHASVFGDSPNDPLIKIEEYERTAEENEGLGIESIKIVFGENGASTSEIREVKSRPSGQTEKTMKSTLLKMSRG